MKKINIFITSAGRKNKYVCISKKDGAYPVIYFRKSKFATKKEFNILMEHILNNI